MDKVIEGLQVTDEQRENNTKAVQSNPLLGQMMKQWEIVAGTDNINSVQEVFGNLLNNL